MAADERSNRIAELDLLRFVAAMSVVFYHRIWTDPGFPDWATGIASYGYLGVPLFFVISGFVILSTAVDRTTWAFLASRISRLYPSFWTGVVITSVLLWIYRDPVPWHQFFANLSMFPKQLFHQDDIDTVYWTLTTEWRFYAMILVLLAARQMRNVEAWAWAWLGAAALAQFVPKTFIFGQLTLAGFAGYFIMGAVLYFMRARGVTIARALMFALSTAVGVIQAGTVEVANKIVPHVAQLIVVVMAIIFLLLALRVVKLPDWRAWYWLGSLTYPLYLLHYKAGDVLRDELPASWNASQRAAVLILLAMATSLAIVLLIERKVCPALNRWLQGFGPGPGEYRMTVSTDSATTTPPAG